MSNPIANIAVRGFQIIFAAVVTGLSVDLAKGHKWGGTPVTLGYASFVGCISLIAGFAGLAATWIEFLQGHISLILDGFIALINLAGGLLIAIKLKGVQCKYGDFDNGIKIISSDLINGGTSGGRYYYNDDPDKMLSRCKMNQADSAFMFLTVIVLLVSLTLMFLRMKKGY